LRQTGRMSERTTWTVEHFSQANPAGEGQGDVPALLRRVADSIDALGKVEVQDLVLHTEVTEDGGWPWLTVYFHPPSTLRSASPGCPSPSSQRSAIQRHEEINKCRRR
jgi:hypothetical protein